MGIYSSHFVDGLAYAAWFVNEKAGYEITFVGHSKGGGEAAASAMFLNKNAIVFNPSVPFITEILDINRRKNVLAFVVTDEILNYYLGELPGDNTIYLPRQHNGWLPGISITDRINNHSMSSVISALIERG